MRSRSRQVLLTGVALVVFGAGVVACTHDDRTTTTSTGPAGSDEPWGLTFGVPGSWSTNQTTPVSLIVVVPAGRSLRTATVVASDGVSTTLADVQSQPAEAAAHEVRIAFQARVRSGVTATIEAEVDTSEGTPASPSTLRRTLFVASDSGDVLSTTAGPDALELAIAARHRPSQTVEQYQNALDAILYDDADSRIAPGGGGPGGGLRVTGQALYTDARGGIHPVRGASVVVADDGTDATYDVGSTDDAGRIDGSLPPVARSACRACRIRVLASYPRVEVVEEASGRGYGIESTPLDLTRDSTVSVTLTANNTADNNTAFSVGDALTTADGVFRRLRPDVDVDLRVNYPTTRLTSSYDPADGQLHVLRGDRFDWDVLAHEYGHLVEADLGLTAGVDGAHMVGHGSAPELGKSAGESLAWAEGFATYFSIASQQLADAASFRIPNVGDDAYTDTEDVSPPISYSLSSEEPTFRSTGPDDELTVQRTLFDLASHHIAGGNGGSGLAWLLGLAESRDVTSLPAMLSTLTSAATASTNACVPARPTDDVRAGSTPCVVVAQVLCAAAEHGAGITVAPDTVAALAAPASLATVTWVGQAMSPAEQLDVFRVLVFSPDWRQIVLQSPAEADAHWVVPASVRAGAARGAHLMVVGWQDGVPVTGPYASCPVTIG